MGPFYESILFLQLFMKVLRSNSEMWVLPLEATWDLWVLICGRFKAKGETLLSYALGQKTQFQNGNNSCITGVESESLVAMGIGVGTLMESGLSPRRASEEGPERARSGSPSWNS